ncbi:hypothetical protein SBA4_530020 [Candidatus Sulfopaludibacter sp. SbA4]|nr:hypothetical protein SBA4_530020 [Candidatus Sulfopaludibacter sp. SbA4]
MAGALPGTTWQYPNWGRKMRYRVEQLRSDGEARDYTTMFRNWIVAFGKKERGAGGTFRDGGHGGAVAAAVRDERDPNWANLLIALIAQTYSSE